VSTFSFLTALGTGGPTPSTEDEEEEAAASTGGPASLLSKNLAWDIVLSLRNQLNYDKKNLNFTQVGSPTAGNSL
jgi:hypothetical protein